MEWWSKNRADYMQVAPAIEAARKETTMLVEMPLNLAATAGLYEHYPSIALSSSGEGFGVVSTRSMLTKIPSIAPASSMFMLK